MLLCCPCWPRVNFVARLAFALTGKLTYPVAACAIAEALLADMRSRLLEAFYAD